MTLLNGWALRMLLALLVGLGAFGAGWLAGGRAQRQADAAERLAQAQAAAEALRRETARADAAVARFVAERRQQEGRYAEMDARYRALRQSAPLVVGAASCAAAVGAAADGGAAGAAPPDAPTGGADAPVLGAGAGGLELSLAAVRMWNGALAGRDLPAGACGAADDAAGAGAACAEGSGIGLDDAWDNHALNARRCAQDRQQLRALIGLLRAQGRAGDGGERAAAATTTPQGE